MGGVRTEAWRLSFSTMLRETALAQLPPSMINEHTVLG